MMLLPNLIDVAPFVVFYTDDGARYFLRGEEVYQASIPPDDLGYLDENPPVWSERTYPRQQQSVRVTYRRYPSGRECVDELRSTDGGHYAVYIDWRTHLRALA